MGKHGQTWLSKNMFRSQLDTFIDVREVPGENKNEGSHKTDYQNVLSPNSTSCTFPEHIYITVRVLKKCFRFELLQLKKRFFLQKVKLRDRQKL